MRKNAEELMEGRMRRRMKEEDRFLDRLNRKWAKAESMIGQLMRDGKIVYYIFPVGGKYREGTEFELIDFLIRNRYV